MDEFAREVGEREEAKDFAAQFIPLNFASPCTAALIK
jgi:hypothetical protein